MSLVANLTPIILGVDQLGNILSAIFNYFLVPITAFFLRMTAALLDIALELTVGMSSIIDNMPVIDVIWKTIRDFASMGFIFMLLYASILMILGVDGGQKYRTLLLNIILCGVLVNFSLFFVKVGIDASNTLSLTIYNAIRPSQDVRISEILAQALQLQRPFSNVGQLKAGSVTGTAIIAGVGTMTMFIVSGFMFLAAALLFLYRFIALILLLAFSPLPFVAWVIPQAGEFAKKFKDNLLSQLIVAPVYLAFLYIALKIVTEGNLNDLQIFKDIRGVGQVNILLEIFPPGMILQYVLVVVVMIAGLMAAQKGGAAGSKFVLGALGDLGKATQAAVMRNTAGRAGQLAKDILEKADKVQFADDSVMGRVTRGGMTLISGATLGTVGKKTLEQARKGLVSAAEGAAKNKYGGSISFSDENKLLKDRKKEVNIIQREVKLENTIDSVVDPEKAKEIPAEKLKETMDAFKAAVAKITVKDMEEIGVKKFKTEALAGALSSKQVESILKSDKLDDNDRDEIRDARAKGLVASLKNPENVLGTKPSDLEAILKEEFTPAQKKEINDARAAGFKELITRDGEEKLLYTHLKGKPADIAKLPPEILSMPRIATRLDAAALKEITRGNVDQTTRSAIRAAFDAQNKSFRDNNSIADDRFQKAYDYINGGAAGLF